jgi:hypothetical protein
MIRFSPSGDSEASRIRECCAITVYVKGLSFAPESAPVDPGQLSRNIALYVSFPPLSRMPLTLSSLSHPILGHPTQTSWEHAL